MKTKSTEDATEVVEITEDIDEEEQIQKELERLNAEASARTKRERRKANEVKTRTIQRMQLSMTAPLDIGLEQQDQALIADEDMFDLGDTERVLKKKGGVSKFASRDQDEDESEEEDEEESESEEEGLDSDEEREKKTKGLEDELDGLYDSYKERLAERDSKYKVKEARKKNKEREEWHGIKEAKDGSSDEEEDEEGGWDVMQKAKGRNDQSSDEESDSDEEVEDQDVSAGQKRRRPGQAQENGKKKARFATEDAKVVPASSRAADLWFSQDVFGGMDGLDAIPDSDEESGLDAEDVETEEEASEEEADEVSPHRFLRYSSAHPLPTAISK